MTSFAKAILMERDLISFNIYLALKIISIWVFVQQYKYPKLGLLGNTSKLHNSAIDLYIKANEENMKMYRNELCHIRETAPCNVWFLPCTQGKESPTGSPTMATVLNVAHGEVQGRQVNRNTDLHTLMFTCENVLGAGTALNMDDAKIAWIPTVF